MIGSVEMPSGVTRSKASYNSLYKNVKNECKNFWDFVRELVSNSYDGKAENIFFFPHYLKTQSAMPIVSLLIVYDDGKGMDYFPLDAEEVRMLEDPPESSIDAYTSLGMSTNTGSASVGRFCYGTKQVMNKSDAGFILITRTSRMPPDQIVIIDEDRIENELLRNGGVSWRCVSRSDAFDILKRRVQQFGQYHETQNTLLKLCELINNLNHGTVQFIASKHALFHEKKMLDVSGTQRTWKKPQKASRIFNTEIELSLFYTILRFSTRHGNALCDTNNQFSNLEKKIMDSFPSKVSAKLLHVANMKIFTSDYEDGFVVPPGFPRPNESQKNPGDVNAIRGKKTSALTGCWARLGPLCFQDDAKRSFAVTWDQNAFSNLLNDFESLSRRGWTRQDFLPIGTYSSGFRIQVMGVGVCSMPNFIINDLPTNPKSQLSNDEKKMFIALMQEGEKGGALCTIEGNFEVEPNRSKLSCEETNMLKTNTNFMRGFANALHSLFVTPGPHGNMLRYLLKRHSKKLRDIEEEDIEEDNRKRNVCVETATRLFIMKNANTPRELFPLCMTHFIPNDEYSHENQLQHILSLFSPFALYLAATMQIDDRLAKTWNSLRIAMHFSTGIDGVAIQKAHENGVSDPVSNGHKIMIKTKNIELKWSLPNEYNHPLIQTDIIASWDLDDVEAGKTTMTDKLGCEGILNTNEDTRGFGFIMENIRTTDGEYLMSQSDLSSMHKILVISVKDLIQCTFSRYCDGISFKKSIVTCENSTKNKKKRR